MLEAIDARLAQRVRHADAAGARHDVRDAGPLVAGKYELERCIGRGAMGEVWQASHATLGRRVAVKLIDRAFMGDPQALSRFFTEARATAALESRHIVAVLDHRIARDGRRAVRGAGTRACVGRAPGHDAVRVARARRHPRRARYHRGARLALVRQSGWPIYK